MTETPARAEPLLLFVPYVHAFGGVERLLLGLSRFLFAASRRHTVLCFEDRIALASRADWPMTLRELRPRRNPFSEARALGDALRDLRGSRPLLFDLKSAFYAGLLGLSGHVLHLTDPPSLLESDVTKHAFSFPVPPVLGASPRPGILRRLRGEVAHRATVRGVQAAAHVVVMTERIRDEVRMLYGVEAEVIRPGVLARGARAAAAPRHSGPPHRVLSVCRLEKGKNVSWVIRAFARVHVGAGLSVEGAPSQLDIVGTGNDAGDLQGQAAASGLGDRVAFHGAVSDERLAGLFGAASIVVVPAPQGYGLPALEALAVGIPVVLNEGAGVSEILRGSPWIELTANHEDAFASGLERMLARVRADAFIALPPPLVPTERAWAEGASRACGWLA